MGYMMILVKWVLLIIGPLIAANIWAVMWLCGVDPAICSTVAVTVLCALWWVFEPVPIAATALIPFALFPLAGVLDHKQVAGAYGHTLIMLFLGGFLLSAAMEKSGTHRRLAIGMIHLVGAASGKRLVLGFMLASAALSMWISNTATVLMLLPLVMAVLEKIDDERLAVALTLGIAYAGSIGGLGTPIGSPPNVIFMGIYQQATGTKLSFVDWMMVGLPVTVLFLPIAWLVLTRRVVTSGRIDLPLPGPWRWAEIATLVVFTVTAIAWVTRTVPFGGWSAWFNMPGAGDSTVALTAAVFLFAIPDGRGSHLLDWETAQRIPWGLLLLFGGGLAIAKAFDESGLSQALGDGLAHITAWPTVLVVLALCLSVSFLTEVTSNTATTTMLMPILAAAGVAAKLDPAIFMIPAALSASCAFMLPVATPPNAIVFGTGRITVQRMAREGFALNLIGAVVITAVCLLLVNQG